MIQNEREFAVTKGKLAMLAECLAEAEQDPNPNLPEIIRQGDINGLRFLMHDLQAEIAEYEKLREGQVSSLRLASALGDLPSVMSRARVARGWTQSDLAGALGVTEQQVQKDERGGYEKASLARLQRVAEVLGVRISGRARLMAGGKRAASTAASPPRSRRIAIHPQHQRKEACRHDHSPPHGARLEPVRPV